MSYSLLSSSHFRKEKVSLFISEMNKFGPCCLREDIKLLEISFFIQHYAKSCQQPYHPTAQDQLPTEAKQGWNWSVPGWETPGEN